MNRQIKKKLVKLETLKSELLNIKESKSIVDKQYHDKGRDITKTYRDIYFLNKQIEFRSKLIKAIKSNKIIIPIPILFIILLLVGKAFAFSDNFVLFFGYSSLLSIVSSIISISTIFESKKQLKFINLSEVNETIELKKQLNQQLKNELETIKIQQEKLGLEFSDKKIKLEALLIEISSFEKIANKVANRVMKTLSEQLIDVDNQTNDNQSKSYVLKPKRIN